MVETSQIQNTSIFTSSDPTYLKDQLQQGGGGGELTFLPFGKVCATLICRRKRHSPFFIKPITSHLSPSFTRTEKEQISNTERIRLKPCRDVAFTNGFNFIKCN